MKSQTIKTLFGLALVAASAMSSAAYRLHCEGQAGIFFTTLQSYNYDQVGGPRRITLQAHNVAPPNESYSYSDISFGLQQGHIYAIGNLANAFQLGYTDDVLTFHIPGGGSGQVTFSMPIEGMISRTGTGIALATASLAINGNVQVFYRDFYQGSTHTVDMPTPYTMTVQDGQTVSLRQRLQLQAAPSGNESIDIDYSRNRRVLIGLQTGVSMSSESASMYGNPSYTAVQMVALLEGDEFSGSLSDLLSSDDQRYCILNNSETLVGSLEFSGTVGTPIPETLTFHIESSVTRLGLAQIIRFKNFSTSNFDVVNGGIATGTDSVVEVTRPAGPYIDIANGGGVKTRVEWAPFNDEEPAQDGWLLCTDQVYWNAL